MNKYIHKSITAVCPVCKKDRGEVLYSVDYTQSAIHFSRTGWTNPDDAERLKQLKDKIRTLWSGDTCSVVGCLHCQFVFAYPYVSGDAEFYNLAFDEGYPVDKWEFQQTLNSIRNLFQGKSFKLLEAGAGMGHFADKVTPFAGGLGQMTLLEYSNKAISHLTSQGYSVFAEDIREWSLSRPECNHSFDVVCLFQVAEHMDRLHELFQSVHQLLKPGGHFFLAVPNTSRIKLNELNEGWLDMPPNHISRFSPRSFSILGKQNGFELKESAVEPEPMQSVMANLYYQRSIRRLQEGRTQGRSGILASLQFQWIRLKAWLAGKPGESYWVHFQVVD
jgi:SAM-dependent methyltransferase